MWATVKDVKDPEHWELTDKLSNTILHSRANSTVKKYLAAYKHWKNWAKKYGMPAIPAKKHHVGFYLQHLADMVHSKSAVEEACNSLAWVHSTAGLVSPFVKAILEGLQRSLAKPVIKKAPWIVEMLQRMVEGAKISGTLADLRLTTACLLSFAGFLRFSELVNVQPCNIDITVHEEYVLLHIPRSKGDQLRKGDEVVIARCDSATCPVRKLEEYMWRSQMAWSDQRFLFHPICKTKLRVRLHESGSVSYTCLHGFCKKS